MRKTLLPILAISYLSISSFFASAGGGYISGQQGQPSQGGTGTSTVFTAGSVIFSGASGVYTQNNSQLFWDNTNNRLGIGISAPATKVHMSSGTLTIDGNVNNMLDLSGSSALMGIRTINPTQAMHVSSGTILIDGNTTNAFIAPVSTQRSGFGTASPATTLHMSSGALTLDGNVTPLLVIGNPRAQWRSNGDFAMANGLNAGILRACDTTDGCAQITTDGSGSAFIDQTYLNAAVNAATIFRTSISGTVAERMRIASGNGRVGIGTSSPQALLDVAGGIGNFSRTIAQLVAITPTAVGQAYYCNDCSPAKLVVSTGTAVANFADAAGGTFK